jgi:hypothetical protein
MTLTSSSVVVSKEQRHVSCEHKELRRGSSEALTVRRQRRPVQRPLSGSDRCAKEKMVMVIARSLHDETHLD